MKTRSKARGRGKLTTFQPVPEGQVAEQGTSSEGGSTVAIFDVELLQGRTRSQRKAMKRVATSDAPVIPGGEKPPSEDLSSTDSALEGSSAIPQAEEVPAQHHTHHRAAVSAHLCQVLSLFLKEFEDYINDWIPHRDKYLDELIRVDGLGAGAGTAAISCSGCKLAGVDWKGMLRCLDCDRTRLLCEACVIKEHKHHYLHTIQVCKRLFFRIVADTLLEMEWQIFPANITSRPEDDSASRSRRRTLPQHRQTQAKAGSM